MKKPTTHKPTPKAKEAEFPADAPAFSFEHVYEQGRTAAMSGISKDECPHGDGPLKDEWLKGYSFQKGG